MNDRLIIFDFDGVIADSELLANQVLADELSALGHTTSLDDAIRLYMGKHWRDCVQAIEAQWRCILPIDFAERCSLMVRDRISVDLQVIPGASEFISSLGDRPKCIASSSPPEWLQRCLELFELSHHFGGNLFSASVHVARGKPHPDVYLYAAQAMRAEPAHAVVIEDSPTGVRAGVAAGMTVIGLCAGSHIREGHAERLHAAGAQHVVTSFDEVARLI